MGLRARDVNSRQGRAPGRCWGALLLVGALSCGRALLLAPEVAPAPEAPSTPDPAGERLIVSLRDPHLDAGAFAREHGLRLRGTLPALGALLVQGPGEAVTALRADPRVRAAGPDVTLHVAGGCCEGGGEDPLAPATWDAARRAREQAFGPLLARTQGEADVLVAVLDTGCDAGHPDLQGALVPGLSLIPGAPWDEDPNGHGTAMAGLVAGRGRLPGVAPGVRVLPVRVADASGAAALSDVAAGIVAAAERGARVILISLGARRPSPLLADAVALAGARGALVVAAAGNASATQDLYPAALEPVVSVGSLTDAGELACNTALSPTTDLLAPGQAALVAQPGRRYALVSGTSVAAARVAGVAALVCSLPGERSPALLERLLARGARPLPALLGAPDVARAIRAGTFDAARLLTLLETPGAALRLADARVLPAAVRPGERAVALVRVENHGLAASAPARLLVGDVAVEVPALPPLGEQVLRAELTVSPGSLRFALGAEQALVSLREAARPVRDLGLLSARGEPGPDGELTVQAVVEGRGASAEPGALELWLDGRQLETRALPALGAGQTAAVRFELPRELLEAGPGRSDWLQARLALAGGDDDPADDQVWLDLLRPLAAPRSANTQYQQSDDLNLIADAPHRLEPGRAWLPLLVFMPEKGGLNPGTFVELSQVTINARATPEPQTGVPDVLVYDDVRGGATHAPAGLVILDDDGKPVLQNGAPDPRLFQHARLSEPGRANVLRLPRAALGLPSPQTVAEDRYLEVRMRYLHLRQVLSIATPRTGTWRWVLKVTCGVDPRPRLAGTDAYFDAHCHTIAEWYQSDSSDPLAPKRNFCGPLPMLMETAYAVGLTEAVDAVRGRLITTDHNQTLNPGDTLQDRPQVGLSSPGSSNGLSEFERYRELFGATAAEEVTVESWGSITVSGLSVPLPGEQHLLSFRGEHTLGPWHGNSALAQAVQGQTFPRVRVEDVLGRLTTTNRAANQGAALFPAHPFGDWTDADFQLAFEQDPARRTDGSVHVEQTGFVAKGLQFWNSDNRRRELPSSRIQWDDLNPWADPDFQRGNPDWDDLLETGLGRWHQEFLAPCLSYELRTRPGVRFPRKVFALAGNDAHGDFNFQTSRTATILTQQSSFKVSGRAFGRCLTYALADLQPPSVPAQDRAFEAFLDGNAVLTDGPVLTFSLDAEDRFDATHLQWHATRGAHEDADGRIGGGGDFDGRGTALVPRGSAHLRFGYQWRGTPELGGDLQAIEVYRTSAGDPNPVGQKASGKPLLAARGWLAPGAAGQPQEEAIDPAQEGLITSPSALALGGYTEADPSRLSVDARRCYTNPVWAMPFDADVAVIMSEVDAAGVGRIPPGGLRVTFAFDMSLRDQAYAAELKGLESSGDSTDLSVGPLSGLVPVSGSGWSDRAGVRDCVLELTNDQAISLDGPRWPLGGDQVTYVVYLRDPLQDPFGNELNRIAVTFSVQGQGGPATAWPAPPPAGSTTPGTTAPGATPAPGAGSGGGSGGGCALAAGQPRGAGRTPTAGLAWAALLIAVMLVGRRREVRAPS